MKIELHEIPVREVAEGYVDSVGVWNAESGIAQPMMNGGKKYKRIIIRRRREGVV